MRRLLFSVMLLAAVVTVPAVANATGNKKVTFTIATTQEVDSLNVNVGYLVVDFEVWNNIWPTLTGLAAADFATTPQLAESWTSSPDGLTWTFKMRKGMKWSDDTPMGAEDVKYTIDRANEEEWFNYTSTTQNLTAEIPDPDTLVITTSVVDPRLPALNFYVLPKHIYSKLDKDQAANHAADDKIGGGPFMLDELKAGEFVRLVRNPNWWGKKPVMDELIIRFFADAEAQFQALKSGEVDAVDDIPVQLFGDIKESDGIIGIRGNQGDFSQLGMNSSCSSAPNTGHAALKDPLVRQAINYAIDRDLLVEKSLNGYGTAVDALPVSANRSWDYQAPAAERYTYDPAKAKALLDKAGWVDDGTGKRSKDGIELRLRYFDRNDDNGQVNTEFVIGWLNAVGIATDLDTMDGDTLGLRLGQNDFDLFTWGWVPYVDPDPQLANFITAQATSDPAAAGTNDANWCDPKFDELYKQQQQELDPAKRHALVREMIKIFHDSAAYAVFYRYDTLMGVRSDRWENFVRQPADTGPVFFNNSSLGYLEMRQKGAGGGGSNGSAGVWIGAGAAVVGIAGVGVLMRGRRKRSGEDDADDDRE
jgi:peptide/nickel transport system substrate-binding protein